MRLCDLETAKALQELGYDGEYNRWIDKDDGTVETESYYLYDWHIPCPRLDDAAYFIRDKYGYVISVYPYYESEVEDEPYQYEIQHYDRNDEYWRFVCQRKCDMTYENALSAAVRTVIQFIIEKNNYERSDNDGPEKA